MYLNCLKCIFCFVIFFVFCFFVFLFFFDACTYRAVHELSGEPIRVTQQIAIYINKLIVNITYPL